MNTAYIEMLKKRIAGLEEKEYDLEVWKSGTALLLTRIFGVGNSYSKEIESIRVDYSSWSLRDATADYNPRETCKKLGHEVLDLAIAELQLPKQEATFRERLASLLPDPSGKLEEAIAKKDDQALLTVLKNEKKDTLVNLLAKLLAE